MKSLIFSLIVFATFQASAGTISFVEPCTDQVFESYQFFVDEGMKVGDVTMQALNENNISHNGNDDLIVSIYDTPVGMDAYNIISDSHMLSYGWCYSVNGELPPYYANQMPVSEQDHIVWWFGYAEYKEGQWISMCEPASKTPEFCQ